ncbi:carbohydrate-binding protein [Corynebacterium jeikeium]|uniref:carbohydrate-binding protein n=1 Tax=Corynebacterium jeikeium TaxID=38289 RepID=UPI0001B714F6|nr:carbohydrate-binding protein [Corynebacterium jeikeium]EEW17378.1 hypothetical protein HMPREF0297_0255 [Corynebacterium jeikeium ATCC 43734]OOD30762.1 hypothetical protein BWP03_06805 [Corynebacterium jeikeium]WCZ54125.1 Chitinase A1 precursor [Corynebacterium jeikeium]SUY80569.1 Chitinase A1 precursor [Corynebacterium jeikeium]
MIDLTTYSEDQLLDLQQALADERKRRAALPAVEEAAREAKEEVVAEVTERLAEKDVKLKPPAKADTKVRPWKPWHPLDTATHFYYGDLATNGGKTWRDVLDKTRTQLNVWEPGSPGIDERYWVEVTEDKPEPETGEQPDEPTEDNPADETEPATPEWKPNTTVKPGERYTHQGATYEVIQGHTTQAGWEPPAVPALWQKV